VTSSARPGTGVVLNWGEQQIRQKGASDGEQGQDA
jgi:hypothetical protein